MKKLLTNHTLLFLVFFFFFCIFLCEINNKETKCNQLKSYYKLSNALLRLSDFKALNSREMYFDFPFS